MDALVMKQCPKLEDVQAYLLSSPRLRLPEDIAKRAQESALRADSAALPFAADSSALRIALLCAAAAMVAKGSEKCAVMAAAIVDLLNALPALSFAAAAGQFGGSVFDVAHSDELTDAALEGYLSALFAPLAPADDEAAALRRPFVSAAEVLLTTALSERLVDYAALVLCIEGEIGGAQDIPSDQYTRENSPLYMSKAAQSIRGFVNGSKLIKKKGGNDRLIALVDVISPLLGTVASIRTNIAKAQYFYSALSLQTHKNSLLQGIGIILGFISGAEKAELTIQNATKELITAVYNKYVAVKEIVDERQAKLTKGRLQFGQLTKEFQEKVQKEGFECLSKLVVFKAPQGKVVCKVPNGVRDIGPKQMKIREEVIALVTSIFKRHGAVSIDTPVFELREVLTEKYGEESKLIYNLEDQGGELLSLRYDLTVPFARYLATSGEAKLKRYQISKVYRRESGSTEQGRFREFYQCDFDIAGSSGVMIADSEVISIIYELLTSIGGICDFDFEIKVSHRQILSAMTKIANVPAEKFTTVCSAIDKYDKISWEGVRKELLQKGLSEESADKIHEYLIINGKPFDVIAQLRQKEEFVKVAGKIIDEMEILFNYLQALGSLDKIDFNLSLARGLDYYTGVIFEAAAKGTNVGSISGGGRYDGLIGMFSNRKIPAVGASLGIERIFAIMEKKMELKRGADVDVLVFSLSNNLTKERLQVASQLWKAGIPCEFLYKEKPSFKEQIEYAEKIDAKLAVIIGPDEVKEGKLNIKDLKAEQQITINQEDLIAKVKELLHK